KGHYVAVKCNSESDCRAWLEALQSHCQQDPQRSFVQPVERPLPCSKRVVIVDLGGCSIRAGVLMEQPALPTVYFPSVCSTDRTTGKRYFGLDAVKPEVRRNSQLSFPLLPSAKISKVRRHPLTKVGKMNARDIGGLPASICLSIVKLYMITGTLCYIECDEHGVLVRLWLESPTSTAGIVVPARTKYFTNAHPSIELTWVPM
ncbi:uncharacterized protein LOC125756567, partial [Rhipicephalus sanguineus]|uniref:uncharacterized protein LOC125756567 n=1 Tax=Rhipicephalus sanguineus TaxID=34632 RepID=UPI0020C3F828